jgi:hypothetical protein
LNILHIGNSGVGTGITAGLKKLGHNSRVLVPTPHPFGFKEDIILYPKGEPAHFRTIIKLKTLLPLRDVDIFHEHMLNFPFFNVLRLRNTKAKRVFHYHSSRDQYEQDPPEGIYDAKFLAMPTRLNVNKNSIWIPLPIDTETKKITEPKVEKKEVIVGIGSDFADRTKGKFLRVDLVNKAIKNLQNKGYKITTLEFNNYKHRVMDYWKQIDIWIDRFHLGFYGFTAPEAASCGIPVLCDIEEDMEQYVPNCPFMRTKPSVDNIESNLEYLLSYSNQEHLGKKCREYAIQKHDEVNVAQKCLDEYKRILN